MNTNSTKSTFVHSSNEFEFSGVRISGILMLVFFLLILAETIYCSTTANDDVLIGVNIFISIILMIVISAGLFIIEPNEARVLLFFGKYRGTMRENGFYWINPLLIKKKITERARNLDVNPIKVNDKTGNPILIGLVLVWKVTDTYKPMFDIDTTSMTTINLMSSLEKFVHIQSDAALREVAGRYNYDNNEAHENETTLRSGGEQISQELELELNNRLHIAGIEVVEARINYLAYAPEIAAVMLRRQQATAIISAREKIVEGAVGMVRLALDKLKDENVIELDEEKKAAMVSNLLVVLCADESAQPVINTGNLNQ